jgi:hypothetical protein
LLQGLVVCGRCGERMTIRYYVHHGQVVPEYLCQKRGIEKAEPPCQRLLGKDIDRAIGDLLVGTVTPLALEMALTVHDELVTRAAQADDLRHQQVDRARYEAELAQRRYLAVDPDNRLLAQSLEAERDHKLRALRDAQDDYERRREAAGRALEPSAWPGSWSRTSPCCAPTRSLPTSASGAASPKACSCRCLSAPPSCARWAPPSSLKSTGSSTTTPTLRSSTS